MAIPILAFVLGACTERPAPARPNAADPNAPAVVQLPPVILPSDTAKPDTTERVRQRLAEATSALGQNYAVLGTAIVFGDRRMIASQYAPDAVLRMPGATHTGSVAIANTLAALGPPKSLKEFKRTSQGTRIADSTVADSGDFVAISKRAGADSLVERGTYVTTWRIHPPPMTWVIKTDELRPRATRRPKG